MFSAFFSLTLLAAAPLLARPDAIVVAPREFLPALQPLIDHRRQAGHEFVYVSNLGSPDTFRSGIREAARLHAINYVLIVGDAEPAARVEAAVAARSVPTHLEKAVVNIKWGSESEIASDNWY